MSKSSSSPDAEATSVDTFFKSVLRSGLLDREQLQAAILDVRLEHREDPQAIAEHLIKKGKLSRFQANKLLKGTGRGLILGNYQILAPLGKGGMGTVYMARDQRTGQLVALKVLPPQRARAEERMLIRFQREMELCRLVKHPHVALTYETGNYKDVYFIAMEYIPGKSLYRVVADEGPLDAPQVAHLGQEVAAGLEHAHEQGLIHRDLKPSNILVTPHNHAKVLDLGLALVAGEKGEAMILGGQGYIVGSMDYISPEQTMDASKVDCRADIYGLGCTLYFALTGHPPFPGGTRSEKIHKHRNELPTPLFQLRPDLPMDFADVIHRMMAKDPNLRLPSAQAVVEALRPWALVQHLEPLDRPEDSEFQKAVAALQTAETPTDFSSPELPVLEDSGDVVPMSVALDQQLSADDPVLFHERRRREAQLHFLLIVGGFILGAVLGGVLLMTCIVSLLFRK